MIKQISELWSYCMMGHRNASPYCAACWSSQTNYRLCLLPQTWERIRRQFLTKHPFGDKMAITIRNNLIRQAKGFTDKHF